MGGWARRRRAPLYQTRGNNDGAAAPALLFTLPGAGAPEPLPRGTRARAAAPPRRPLREGALPCTGAATASPGASPGAAGSAPRAGGTRSGKGGRAGGAAGARRAGRQPGSGAARGSAGLGGAAGATRSFLGSTATTTLSIPRKATPNSSIPAGGGGRRGRSVHQTEDNHNLKMYLQFPGKTKSR